MAAFDILLAFYGDLDLLRRAVESVLAQDRDDWRLVVLDDGYPDQSIGAWLKTLAHPSITYLRHRENEGANASYRELLALAEADYVVFLGADDEMLPEYLSIVGRAIQGFPEAVAIHPGVEVIDETGALVRPLVDQIKTWLRPNIDSPLLLSGEPLAAGLMRGNWTYFPSLCWKREQVARIGFRPGLHVLQDLALLLDVVTDGGQMVLVPEIALRYRRHPASDSTVKALSGARFSEERNFFSAARDEFVTLGWIHAARAARLHVTSRLNAASQIPRAVQHRMMRPAIRLVRHAIGP